MNALAPATFLAAAGGSVIWLGLYAVWPTSDGVQAVLAVLLGIVSVSAMVMMHALVFGVRRQELEFTGAGFVLRQDTGLRRRAKREAYTSLRRVTHHGDRWVRVELDSSVCWIDVAGFVFTEREWIRASLERCRVDGPPALPPPELARLLVPE